MIPITEKTTRLEDMVRFQMEQGGLWKAFEAKKYKECVEASRFSGVPCAEQPPEKE